MNAPVDPKQVVEEMLSQDAIDTTQGSEGSIATMTDDEIMKLDLDAIPVKEEAETEQETQTPGGLETPEQQLELDLQGSEQEQEDEQQEEKEKEETADKDKQYKVDLPPEIKEGAEKEVVTEKEEEEVTKPKEKETEVTDEVNYKEQYEALFEPIKVGNKQITLDSIDDVRTLVSKGLDYNNSMRALKPMKRIYKVLEQNNIGENDLNYLIDLHKKNPNAIKKLIVDNPDVIDPLEDTKEAVNGYTPANHANQVTDSQIELERINSELQAYPDYQDLTQDILKSWDEESRNFVAQNPEVLRSLYEQKTSGLYTQIDNEITREQALGRLNGVPYLQAYYNAGNKLAEQNQLGKKITPDVEKPKQRTQETEAQRTARNNKKNAVSPTASQATKQSSGTITVNPLAMSDEAFEEMFPNF